MKKISLWVSILCLSLFTVACNNAAAPDFNANNNNTPNGYNAQNTDRNMSPLSPGNINNNRLGNYDRSPLTNNGMNERNSYMNDNYNRGAMDRGGYTYSPRNIYKNTGGTRYNRMGTNRNVNTLGYARVNANQLRNNGAGVYNGYYVDRNALAQIVGGIVASQPGVDDCTSVVTDEEIFIGLNTDGNNDKEAIRNAKMAAASISPSYYTVYVTNDDKMMNRIRSLNDVDEMNGKDNGVDQLIRDLGGTTDGDKADKKKIGNTYIPDQK